MRPFALRLMAVWVACAAAFASSAPADQAAYITNAEANKAVGLIKVGSEIRHFCPPAGDTTWRSEQVASKAAEPAGYEDYYEVKVNGAGIDLAYVYIPEGERWANLAMRTGVAVTDVPEFLPDAASGGEGEPEGEGESFQLSHYKGLIDGRLVIYMDLWRGTDTLEGTYSYASKGIPIDLEGTVDADHSFTATEHADAQKTGMFIGKLSEEGGRLEGSWVSPDGARRLSFAADRFAELKEESISLTIEGRSLEGNLVYPRFTLADEALATKLTQAGYERLRAAFDRLEKTAREDFAASKPEPGAEPVSYTFDAAGYEILYFSPSLVSIAFTLSEYTGGAHPNTFYDTLNLQVTPQGELRALRLEDLFKPGTDYVKRLSGRAIADLRRQEAQWVLDGELKELDAEALAHIAVTPRGFRLCFDPYAAGPYAQGPFEVDVPLDTLENAIDPEGPLRPLLPRP